MIKAYANRKVFIYANCNKLQRFSDYRSSSCRRSCSRRIKKEKKKKRIEAVSLGFTLLLHLVIQQTQKKGRKKTRFLNVSQSRKLQIAVILQASWHNNISTFNCNKLRINEKYNSQQHTNNPHLQPKIIGF